MSSSQRIEGDRVYCHECDHEWERARGGLQCPQCNGEFVEILETSRSAPNSPPPIPPHPTSSQAPPVPPHPRSPQSSMPSNPFHDHNPWAPDPDEDDITTFEFNTGGGRGTFSFTSRTYTIGGGNIRRDVAADEINRNFELMLSNLMGFNQRRQPQGLAGVFAPLLPTQTPQFQTRGLGGMPEEFFPGLTGGPGQQRSPHQALSPFDLLGAILNPAHARHGDMVFSQEAFDRVMTQLMEQNSSSAPGPATDAAIAALRKKPVDAEMLGSDGKAECSICMDNVELGDEVTVLPCNHWFHGDCVISWLREHDTCPHCRSPISNQHNANATTTSPRRRRTSRRSSSVASPMNATDGNAREASFSDSPSGIREARQSYYGSPRSTGYDERPPRERRSSERSQRSSQTGAAENVANWIRSRLPFSGAQ